MELVLIGLGVAGVVVLAMLISRRNMARKMDRNAMNQVDGADYRR